MDCGGGRIREDGVFQFVDIPKFKATGKCFF